MHKLSLFFYREGDWDLKFDKPVDRADTGYVVLVADALGQEPVSDLPGEHGGVVFLVLGDGIDHVGRRYLGLTSANHTSFVISGFVKSEIIEEIVVQNLSYAYLLIAHYNSFYLGITYQQWGGGKGKGSFINDITLILRFSARYCIR